MINETPKFDIDWDAFLHGKKHDPDKGVDLRRVVEEASVGVVNGYQLNYCFERALTSQLEEQGTIEHVFNGWTYVWAIPKDAEDIREEQAEIYARRTAKEEAKKKRSWYRFWHRFLLFIGYPV